MGTWNNTINSVYFLCRKTSALTSPLQAMFPMLCLSCWTRPSVSGFPSCDEFWSPPLSSLSSSSWSQSWDEYKALHIYFNKTWNTLLIWSQIQTFTSIEIEHWTGRKHSDRRICFPQSMVDSDSWQFEFMVMVLAIVVVINCATAIFQVGLTVLHIDEYYT